MRASETPKWAIDSSCEQLRAILLTDEGAGKAVKEIALSELLLRKDWPATADPATFPKADQAEIIAKNIHACLDNRDRLAKLTPLQLIASALESDASDYDVVIELMNRVLPFWEQLHEKTIEAARPSAGTEQKDRGEAERLLAVAQSLDDGTEPGTHRPAPTDETTTPRTDAVALSGVMGSEVVTADFARQLERELNATKIAAGEEGKQQWEWAHAWKAREKEFTDLTARLALTEKRLEEAQGEVRELREARK